MKALLRWAQATAISMVHTFAVTLAATGLLGTAVLDKVTLLNDLALAGTAAGATLLAAIIAVTGPPKVAANLPTSAMGRED